MAINVAFRNALFVDGVEVRRYTTLSPSWTLDDTYLTQTPYIKHNVTPKISWVASGAQNTPMTFNVVITWVGNGVIQPIDEIVYTDVSTQGVTIQYNQRLQHANAVDAGGEYSVLVTARQSGSADVVFGGRFKVNYRPKQPTNLHIT